MTFDNAGNTLNTARKLNITSISQTLNDFVGLNDQNDFYSFSLSSRSRLNLSLSGFNADADVRIVQDINSNGMVDIRNEFVTRPLKARDIVDSTITTLNAGNYFIHVYSNSNVNTSYNFSVSATPDNTSLANRVLELVNKERERSGVSPLQLNSQLNQAAQSHSEDMALKDYFSHTGRDGREFDDRILATGYRFSAAAENVAAGQHTPEDVLQAWMNSSGHRHNILNSSYKDIGIGYYSLSNDTGTINYNDYWTQKFAAPLQSGVNPTPNSLFFDIENPTVSNGGTLNIRNGNISDGSGVRDISLIDLQILQNGTVINPVSNDISGTNIIANPSNNRSGSFTHNLSLAGLNLGAGNYTLRAVARDSVSQQSNIFERQFSIITPPTAPNSLFFDIENPTVSNTGTLNIRSGQVSDANGVRDISLIDLQIVQNGSVVNFVSNDILGTNIIPNSSDNRSGSFTHNLSLAGLNLGAGNYTLRAIARDRGGLASNIIERNFIVNTAPSSLFFNIENSTVSNTGTLNIRSGQVFDANGVRDISLIDLQILQNGSVVNSVSNDISGTNITPNFSNNRWGSFTHNLSLAGLNLAPGNYTLRAVARDSISQQSNIVERLFTITNPPNISPNSLSFNIENPTVSSTGTLNISSGQVSDANGVRDISLIDLQILQNGSVVNFVSNDIQGTNITVNPSDNRSGSFTHNLSLVGLNLGAGNHTLRAIARDRGGLISNIVERNFIVNTAPSSLSFNIENPTVGNTGTLNIRSGQVFDGNGVRDISLIDLQILQNGSVVNSVSNDILGTNITPNSSDNRSGSFSHNLSLAGFNLAAGNYTLRVVARDSISQQSNIAERQFSVTNPQNIAPSSLFFNIENPTVSSNGTLNIRSGQVFDANGVRDISLIDLQILKNGSMVNSVSNDIFGTNITPNSSDNRWGSFSHNLSLTELYLPTGNYTLRAVARDSIGQQSQIVEHQFSVTTPATAPSSLSFDIENPIVGNTGVLNIRSGQVFDRNGVRDISLIDLQILRNSSILNFVSNDILGTNITPNSSDNSSGSFTHNLSLAGLGLDGGNYILRAIARDRDGLTSNIVERNFIVNTAPSSLSFNIENPTVSNTGTLNIRSGQVVDANGVRDISIIDLQILQNGSGINSVSNDIFGTNITPTASDNRWGSFTHNLSLAGLNLAAGNYTLRAIARDSMNQQSQIVERQFSVTTPAIGDWYDINLKDQQIISLVRSLASDNNLSRNDMISLFRDARDGNIIDAFELTDLKTIVSNASRFTMQDHVRVLSNKVVNSEIANITSTIGNLTANSSAEQLDRLLGKWFFGNDRPQTTYQYAYANGSLFQNGVSYQDVFQGAVGNCYFLAGLAATALRTPDVIRNMFIDNGDNTFTVRYYNEKVADYVTVDRHLPQTSWGSFIFANQGGRTWGSLNNPANELWVALAEKAYAQLNESGWIKQDNTNSYMGIESGWEGNAIKHITGRNATFTQSFNMNTIVQQLNAGQLVTLASKESNVSTNIVENHAYVVVGYNTSTQRFILFNPWGVSDASSKPGILELSWSEVEKNFSQLTYTA
jgi:uncharacterized protein YkwD